MTEIGEKNREAYLSLIKKFWNGFDDASMKYIEERTKDTWEFVPEFKELMDKFGVEDQRVRFDLDMQNPSIQKLFRDGDKAYGLFRRKFENVLGFLSENGNTITYSNFIENTAVFRKNKTKIKKIFQTIYEENQDIFGRDFGTTDKTKIEEKIVKAFEEIGTYKKSSKKIQMVLTWNPADWLLSSTAQPNYSSCFNIDNPREGGYKYMTGLPFLCGDKNRIMVYVTDGTKKEFMGINVDSIMTRSWIILDKVNNFCVVKWYPMATFDVDSIINITKIKNFVSGTSFQGGKYDLDPLNINGIIIYVYNDMGNWDMDGKRLFHSNEMEKGGQQIFTVDGTNIGIQRGDSSNSYQFNFDGSAAHSFKLSEWKKNGWSMKNFFRKSICSSCGKEDTGFFVNGKNGTSFICHECYSTKIITCPHCGNTYNIEEGKSPEFHFIKFRRGPSQKVCKSCYESMKDYICDICGTYSENGSRTDDKKYICKNCIDSGTSGYKKCSTCGTLSKNSKAIYSKLDNSLKFSCKECFKNIKFSEDYSGRGLFGKLYEYDVRDVLSGEQAIE